MNIVKRILGHLFCVYALLVFLATLILVLLPVIVTNLIYRGQEYKRTLMIHKIYYVWMQVYMVLIGCPVYRKNVHYFQPGENYVVILNHNSFLDIPISSPWVPGANKTLAKSGFMKVPLFNIIYKSGSILVDRDNPSSRQKSFKDMLTTLREGIHLTLYPEGTRNKTSEPLLRFHDGAFKTALVARKDIMIGVIFNTKKVLPSHPAFWGWPHKIRIEYLPPVDISQYGKDEVARLKADCHQLMKDYYTSNAAS